MTGSLRNTLTLLADNFALPLTFLSTTSTSALETQFFSKLVVYQWVLTVRLYWLTCFSTLLSTISCLKLWKQTCKFTTTFCYIDDLFSINNDNFGNSIREIYSLELELKDTTLSSTEVCYLDTKIVHGDRSAPFHISVYDKREDLDFRIVNFPFMDSNIPATPAYGVYVSQLVRYARICTAKADFMHRLCSLSSRLKQQGFKSSLSL